MSRKDMLGPLTRALVGVPVTRLGLVLNIANRLGSTTGGLYYADLKAFDGHWREPISSNVISIDRTHPFNPVEFLGQGWKIGEEDERSLALTEVDLSTVRFEHMLKQDEKYITGEEKLKRLKKAGHIRLDARVFQILCENQHLIPESWKEKIGDNITYIFFDGTILQYPGGHRYALYLFWLGGRWCWYYDWLGHGWYANDPSAILASSS